MLFKYWTYLTLSSQLTIEARDLGVPSRSSVATLEITILFDPTQLTFTAANYNVSISENTPVNNVITTVMAQPAVSLNKIN